MTAVVMMLLGAGVGMGVLLLAHALRPSSPPIDEIFQGVSRPGQRYVDDHHVSEQSLRDRLSGLGGKLALLTGDAGQLSKDLAVTGSTLGQHGLVKTSAPALTIAVVYVLWAALALVGHAINPAVTAIVALGLAMVAFVLPDIRLRARAKARRAAFRHALSAYLDLVAIIMAGGGGLLTALQSSAEAGDGWAFAEIRAALDRARLSNRTPWSQLGVLSDRFDIPALADVVATAELAGSEGSRVTESISTKADVLRARLHADVEQTSESLTEQMLIPVGLLLVALFMFLGFAVSQQIGSNTQPGLDLQAVGMLRNFVLWGR